MGEHLTHRILREWPDNDIDVVIPIPDTSRTAALPLAYELNVKYREGFIKNRYIPRTFIMPVRRNGLNRCDRNSMPSIWSSKAKMSCW